MEAIYLTEKDYQRLHKMIRVQRFANGSHAVEALSKALERAKVVSTLEIPPDVITMNSMVRLKEIKSRAEMIAMIVYPKESDLPFRKVSVLAPIGTAVLGCKVGDEIA
jgi:regulator of nucleoside diphosphate kinase